MFQTAVLALDLSPAEESDAKDATPALPLMARAALHELATWIEAGGSRCEVLVLEGDPHETIAHVAADRDCSLIVVGKHGQHWV
jgi:nucleotide-binding universal stress UspA family protein